MRLGDYIIENLMKSLNRKVYHVLKTCRLYNDLECFSYYDDKQFGFYGHNILDQYA